VNHSHYLSGVNLSEYASFRNFKVPVLFGISYVHLSLLSLSTVVWSSHWFRDNNISISLRGMNWLSNEWIKKLRMPCYLADGNDILDIW
jgi:hypothetical protein